MTKLNEEIGVGLILDSVNYGKFKVVEYSGAWDVKIEFVDTGYISVFDAAEVRKGRVKDKLYPTVYGIGVYGDGEFKKKHHSKSYNTWASLMRLASKNKIRVCQDWINFQNFSKWFYAQPSSGYKHSELYRDPSFSNEISYSPETCKIIKTHKASVDASVKAFRVIDPYGNVFEGKNIAEFARDKNLGHERLGMLISGKISNYKGWKKGA